MKFDQRDYARYVPPVKVPVLSLLFFPPSSHTPSGFYLIKPGPNGNILELVEKVEIDPRTEKAWYMSESERAQLVNDAMSSDGPVRKALAGGATWSSLPAEELVVAVMSDPGCQKP